MTTHIDQKVTSKFKEYIKLLINKYEKDKAITLIDISDARSQGDLKENSAYHQARDRYEQIDNNIKTSESYLLYKEYSSSDINNKDYIDFGATFTIEIDDKKCTYLILDDPESNFDKNIISRQSPIGRLFINKRVGDIIMFPNNILNYAVKINRGQISKNLIAKTSKLVIKDIKYNNLDNLYDDIMKDDN